MKAAVCREFGKPLVIEEVNLAKPQASELRVKILATAICHSDISYADGAWGGTLPAIFGHESVGVVEEVGAGETRRHLVVELGLDDARAVEQRLQHGYRTRIAGGGQRSRRGLAVAEIARRQRIYQRAKGGVIGLREGRLGGQGSREEAKEERNKVQQSHRVHRRPRGADDGDDAVAGPACRVAARRAGGGAGRAFGRGAGPRRAPAHLPPAAPAPVAPSARPAAEPARASQGVAPWDELPPEADPSLADAYAPSQAEREDDFAPPSEFDRPEPPDEQDVSPRPATPSRPTVSAGPSLDLPPPGSDPLSDRWAELVGQLQARGLIAALVRELAIQAQCIAHEDGGTHSLWRLRVERESLRSDNLRDRLAQALSELLGHEARLELERGVAFNTPAQRDQVARELRQQRAEQLISGDPLVQQLMQQYPGARLVPGSIQPLADEAGT